jgi:hypothetical protein
MVAINGNWVDSDLAATAVHRAMKERFILLRNLPPRKHIQLKNCPKVRAFGRPTVEGKSKRGICSYSCISLVKECGLC